VPVSVARGTNPKGVIQILLELADGHTDVMKDPVPVAIHSEIGPNAITIALRVWTLTQAANFAQLRSELYLLILRRFKEEKIEMPFAQLDLHVKSIEVPVSVSNVHQGAKSEEIR
jgi:potassium efflux system protein